MSASKIFGSFEESHTPTDLQDKKKMKFSTDGRVRISEEVIAELASQALMKVIGVQPDQGEGGTRLAQGVDIMVEEEGGPSVVVDAYIRTKFGLMIPDIAWYVQESIRNSLEQNTGYNIKAVNVFVKGLYFEDVKKPVLEMTIKEKVQPSPPSRSLPLLWRPGRAPWRRRRKRLLRVRRPKSRPPKRRRPAFSGR